MDVEQKHSMNAQNSKRQSSKKHPFTVPDGYFEQLQADILARCNQSIEQPTAGVVPLWHRLSRPLIGVAAMLCIAFFSATIYMNSQHAETLLSDDSAVSAKTEGHFVSDNAEDYILMDNDDMYRYLAGMY